MCREKGVDQYVIETISIESGKMVFCLIDMVINMN